MEIEGLLSDIEGTFKNLNEGTILDQEPEENIEQSHHDDDEQLERRSLVRMDRIRLRAPKDVAKINVGFLNPGEIEERMRELYERTVDGWRCLVCDHTNKASKSSKIRMLVKPIWMDWCSPALYAARSSGQEIFYINVKPILTSKPV